MAANHAPLSYQLVQLETLAEDIFKVILSPTGNNALKYQAGQYVEFCLPSGLKAPFSIANAPKQDSTLEFHLKTGAHHQQTEQFLHHIKAAGQVDCLGPYGQFILTDCTSKPLLFIAGGTGFAPIKALLEEALQQKRQQSLHLVWGITHESHEYDQDWLFALSKLHPNFSYQKVISQPKHTHHIINQGLVHKFVEQEFTTLSEMLIFASGPYNMVQAIKTMLIQKEGFHHNLISDML